MHVTCGPVTVFGNGFFAGDAALQEFVGQFQRHGVRAFDAHLGDFALVVWDEQAKMAWLARSPLSSFPLFYNASERHLIISSDARLVSSRPLELNLQSLAAWYGAQVGAEREAMFKGATVVPPGTFLRISDGVVHGQRFWSAANIEQQHGKSLAGAGLGLRNAFEEAVAECVAGRRKPASQVSSGRDSAAVTMVAARQLAQRGLRLSTYTASPGDAAIFSNRDMLVDEADGARAVIARAANIDHTLVSERKFPFCKTAEEVYKFHPAPMGNPLSLYWWHSIQNRAASAGHDLILQGAMGNLTISDGGPIYLPDVLRAGKVRQWWRGMRDVTSFHGASWTNAFNLSVGGMIPRLPYGALEQVYGRSRSSSIDRYLTGALREMVRDHHRRHDLRPPRSSHDRGGHLIDQIELGDRVPKAFFGLDMRDPTADRRVVEAWLRIPTELKLSRYDRRPIFEAAFGDLISRDCIRAPRRAYQSMDWNFAYDTEELKQGLDRYSANPRIADHVDLEAVKRAIDFWPNGRMPTLAETADIGNGMLKAVSLAAFLHVNFPN
nr:asparagine synthetase B family protein [uncultured Sphingomonas sp.]